MSDRFDLPLVSTPTSIGETPSWEGWSPATPLPDSPEPLEPQGAYAEHAASLVVPLRPTEFVNRAVELLAPAGGPDAAHAAFHFGADAVYLGLKKFSARAEAENFTLEEVDEITAYAHQLHPRRRVFVTINTLIRQDELEELVTTVAALGEIGVDAVILQDLGVYRLLRDHFPHIELHASTQLAVHNGAGASVLRQLGFHRAVLARELTFEEVRDITATSGIETEVFIHGALCYSYSGLCLFSSQTLGRSGNRGKCAYSCRDSYEVEGAPLTLRDGQPVRRDPGQGFPFSMKDLALPDHLPALRAAGVSCFKVEGRKKSPLYVATTTDYYRRLLDGRLDAEERPDIEADLQTVFSRPWTHLFVDSHRDKEVADRDTVGHRGTPIGQVEGVQPGPNPTIRFRTNRPLERHDGLQVDLPTLGKPFGFPVDRLWKLGKRNQREEVFEATANTFVEVLLPRDHPDLPLGAPVYCSSSQAVKNRYRHDHPKPGQFRTRQPVAVEVTLSAKEIVAVGRWVNRPEIPEARATLAGPIAEARDGTATDTAIRTAFAKLGDTGLSLASVTIHNDENRFVPVSRLNQIRRDLVNRLEESRQIYLVAQAARLVEGVTPRSRAVKSSNVANFDWSMKVDRVGFLDALEDSDLEGVDEILIDIARDHPAILQATLDKWAERIGREHIRLALSPLTRSWEEKGLVHKVRQLRAAGWNHWEAGNLSAWAYLDIPVSKGPDATLPVGQIGQVSAFDLATDWSVYVLNRLAARELLHMGVSRFVLSPEDGLTNIRSLLSEFAAEAVVLVYQDTPQFLAESCAYANLIGGCPGKANCRFESMEMVSSHGERVTAIDYHCRTIVLNQGPFCLSTRLGELSRAGARNLRADFIYRAYNPLEVRDRWRLVRAGRPVPFGHAANFDRGIL